MKTKYLMYAALAVVAVLAAHAINPDPFAVAAAGLAVGSLELVAHGIDRGAVPARIVQHHYRMMGKTLYHFTDGDLRAQVPPEGQLDFLVDHPDARPLFHKGDQVKAGDLEARCHERMFARMTELEAHRGKSAPSSKADIDAKIDQAVDEALARYTQILQSVGLLDAEGRPVRSPLAAVGPSNPQAAS
jgi:hypothetical protein